MKVLKVCEGSGLKTTNPITILDAYFKTSVCPHCKHNIGVRMDYEWGQEPHAMRFDVHAREGT